MMKTIKLSLSALAALCYLVLFTACQDDTVENDLQPTADASGEAATIAEAQQILQDYMANSTFDPDAINARVSMDGAVTYDEITINVFGEKPNGTAGSLRKQYVGPARLVPVESLPFVDGDSDDSFQLYDGVYVSLERIDGAIARKQIAAIQIVGTDVAFVIIANIPSGNNVQFSTFSFGEDFSNSVSDTNRNGKNIIIEVDAKSIVE